MTDFLVGFWSVINQEVLVKGLAVLIIIIALFSALFSTGSTEK